MPSPVRADRDDARWKIIQAANRFKINGSRRRVIGHRVPQPSGQGTTIALGTMAPVLFGMRQIQQAVCVVRRNRLVDGETLTLAGYNAKAR